ncbi:hypothetical protein MRX96_027034 [Rhipicephalus microplus]
MIRGQGTEQRQPLRDNHIWNTEDEVLPGPCGLGIPGSSGLLVFDVASCSITGFSVVALPSFLRRSVMDKPAIRSVCAYIPRLFECAEIDFQDRSALYGYIISAASRPNGLDSFHDPWVSKKVLARTTERQERSYAPKHTLNLTTTYSCTRGIPRTASAYCLIGWPSSMTCGKTSGEPIMKYNNRVRKDKDSAMSTERAVQVVHFQKH